MAVNAENETIGCLPTISGSKAQFCNWSKRSHAPFALPLSPTSFYARQMLVSYGGLVCSSYSSRPSTFAFTERLAYATERLF